MTNFLALAERAGLAFSSYQCEAEGRLELVEGKLQVTLITLRSHITLTPGGMLEKPKS